MCVGGGGGGGGGLVGRGRARRVSKAFSVEVSFHSKISMQKVAYNDISEAPWHHDTNQCSLSELGRAICFRSS